MLLPSADVSLPADIIHLHYALFTPFHCAAFTPRHVHYFPSPRHCRHCRSFFVNYVSFVAYRSVVAVKIRLHYLKEIICRPLMSLFRVVAISPDRYVACQMLWWRCQFTSLPLPRCRFCSLISLLSPLPRQPSSFLFFFLSLRLSWYYYLYACFQCIFHMPIYLLR